MSLSSDPDVETSVHNNGIHVIIHKHKRSESLQSLEDPGNAVSYTNLNLDSHENDKIAHVRHLFTK